LLCQVLSHRVHLHHPWGNARGGSAPDKARADKDQWARRKVKLPHRPGAQGNGVGRREASDAGLWCLSRGMISISAGIPHSQERDAAPEFQLTTPSFDPSRCLKNCNETEVLKLKFWTSKLCQLCQLYNARLSFKLVDLEMPRCNFANWVAKVATGNSQF